MKRSKLGILLLVAVLIMSLTVGCGSKPAEPAAPAEPTAEKPAEPATPAEPEEMVLNWNLGGTIETIDPGLTAAVNTGHIVNNTFEGLMREVDGKPTFAMAESFEVSEDGLEYTFKIRDGVKWSDGKPVTAHDFEFAWKRNTDPATASDYAWIFAEVNYEDCKAIDDKTFWAKLSAPADYFVGLTGFSTFMPLREDVVENEGLWAIDPNKVVCNGPYIVSSYTPGAELILVKNPEYWKAEEVKIDKIVSRIIENETTALTSYEAGEILFNTRIPAAEVPRLLAEDDTFRIEARPGTYYMNLNGNTTKELADQRVRRALSLVIDRQAITNILNSGNIPAINFIPPGVKDTNGLDFAERAKSYGLSIAPGEKEIAEAQKLLEEAGYPNGEGLPTFKYITNSGEGHMQVAQAIQEMWKTHLGVNMEIANMEWAVFQEVRKTHDFELARGGWIGDYVDPLTFIGLYKTGNPLNAPEYASAEFDKYIEDSMYAKGQERYELLAKAEEKLLNDGWFIPIYNYVDAIHQSEKLVGVERTVLGKFYFGRAEVLQ